MRVLTKMSSIARIVIDMEENKQQRSFMTSKEVCVKWGISKWTLLNWRRGFYFGKEGKVFFCFDESCLEADWNEEDRQLEYNPIKVAVWVNKIKNKKKYEK